MAIGGTTAGLAEDGSRSSLQEQRWEEQRAAGRSVGGVGAERGGKGPPLGGHPPAAPGPLDSHVWVTRKIREKKVGTTGLSTPWDGVIVRAVITPFVPLGAGGGEGITATATNLVRLPFWYQAILAFCWL